MRRRLILAGFVLLAIVSVGLVVIWATGGFADTTPLTTEELGFSAESDDTGPQVPGYDEVRHLQERAANGRITNDEITRLIELTRYEGNVVIRARACTGLKYVDRAGWQEPIVTRLVE